MKYWESQTHSSFAMHFSSEAACLQETWVLWHNTAWAGDNVESATGLYVVSEQHVLLR